MKSSNNIILVFNEDPDVLLVPFTGREEANQLWPLLNKFFQSAPDVSLRFSIGIRDRMLWVGPLT
jgi:hypothetical protein